MVLTFIVVLFVLWLVSYLGPRFSSRIPYNGNFAHILFFVVAALALINLVGVNLQAN